VSRVGLRPGGRVVLEEGNELGGVDEFGVGVGAGCYDAEDVLGREDGEEVGEGGAGNCGEEEVTARLRWVC